MVQQRSCSHEALERSWVDTYTAIDIQGALNVGYQVVECFELWHYPKGGSKFFRELILNIVHRKMECSGFPPTCVNYHEKQSYVESLLKQSGISMKIDAIKYDPAGHYLNKIMANSVWGKWTQNPSGQQEIVMCSTIREYHDCLYMGQVKRVSLVSDKLLQVEMKRDHNIDSENREQENNHSGLWGNPIVGAFVTAASRDLMYMCYLSKLTSEQLLYMDTDSVIVYSDVDVHTHLNLPMSNLLGDLQDEYGDLLQNNPSWYISEMIAFGLKMYQLVFKDRNTHHVIQWVKTMKGISLKGNADMFSIDKISLYRNPITDFCCILQYGSSWRYETMVEIWNMKLKLKCARAPSLEPSNVLLMGMMVETCQL